MSTINKNNYEAFLLDYFEGSLSSELCAELQQFVLDHPELEVDLNDFDLPVLEAESITELSDSVKLNLHVSKEKLQSRFDELCFAYYEGNISIADNSELSQLRNSFPEFEKEFQAFALSMLKADDSIVYSQKELLKKDFSIVGSFEDLALKSIENEISETEKDKLKLIIQNNPELSSQLRYFRATILPQEEIIFPQKDSLYRNEKPVRVVPIISGLIAIAAAVALIIGIFGIFVGPEPQGSQTAVYFQGENHTPTGIRPVIKPEVTTADSIKNQTPSINPAIHGSGIQNSSIDKRVIFETEYLQAENALPLQQFELPAEYLSLKPLELQQLNYLKENSFAEHKNTQDNYLTAGQFIQKKISRIFKNNKIDIVTPLENIRNEGLTDIGMKGLERASRGKIYLERDADAGKITGLHFFGLSYSKNQGIKN